MKKIIISAGILLALLIVGALYYFKSVRVVTQPSTGNIVVEKKLDQYTYSALRKTTFSGSQIMIDKVLLDDPNFTSYLYYFTVRGKKVSGLMNVPKKEGNYPAIIMVRGYVDKEIYAPGVGTSHGGELMAQNGFITLAPDFLGYGYSDKAVTDPMEDRFLTYVTVLELMNSVKNLNAALEQASLAARFDGVHIGIWGHSNGGQIALTVAELSGKNYPTVLWAPVSKPFPYSILYYTDDIPDHGKALRKTVSVFEQDYDSEKYSLTNYLDWIKAPMQIHQGGADESVPQKWTDELVATLQKKNKDIEYFTYPGEDHNFDQGNWTTTMQRTMAFYNKWFAQQ